MRFSYLCVDLIETLVGNRYDAILYAKVGVSVGGVGPYRWLPMCVRSAFVSKEAISHVVIVVGLTYRQMIGVTVILNGSRISVCNSK